MQYLLLQYLPCPGFLLLLPYPDDATNNDDDNFDAAADDYTDAHYDDFETDADDADGIWKSYDWLILKVTIMIWVSCFYLMQKMKMMMLVMKMFTMMKSQPGFL